MKSDVYRRRFRDALLEAKTYGVDMSDLDLAQAIGVMNTYGHGCIWDLPEDEDGFVDIDKLVEMIENYCKELSEEREKEAAEGEIR